MNHLLDNGEDPNSVLLMNIFKNIQAEINISFNIKDILLKVLKRFESKDINLITRHFIFIRALMNCFVNYMLLEKSSQAYHKIIHTDIIPYYNNFPSTDLNNHQIQDIQMVISDRFVGKILNPLIQKLIDFHKILLDRDYISLSDRLDANTIGRYESLSVFNSFLSFFYGFRFINTYSNKLIVYVQPYFNTIKYDNINYFEFILNTIMEYCKELDKLINLNISFRFCNNKYVDNSDKFDVFDNFIYCVNQLKENNCNSVSISFITNTSNSNNIESELANVGGIYFGDKYDEYDD